MWVRHVTKYERQKIGYLLVLVYGWPMNPNYNLFIKYWFAFQINHISSGNTSV